MDVITTVTGEGTSMVCSRIQYDNTDINTAKPLLSEFCERTNRFYHLIVKLSEYEETSAAICERTSFMVQVPETTK
ncbi:hypothetical protein KIN20_023755 [Parelaphostrongylus tenuis]|uniref:Uncharacterized protein n=1 Tax=Parelaphostrongylus tenuis TaxID=148309 RepID=A0AAD5N9D9_PARTN|nr:hypothetical protein KIN20_023755 [Parelaphostrongylus tenuis]